MEPPKAGKGRSKTKKKPLDLKLVIPSQPAQTANLTGESGGNLLILISPRGASSCRRMAPFPPFVSRSVWTPIA